MCCGGEALKKGLRFANIPEDLLKFRIYKDFIKEGQDSNMV
jgi:hypothetical protein